MDYSVEIESSHNILLVTIEGEISLEDMFAAFEEILPILTVNQNLNILVDLKKASSVKFFTSEAEKLGEAYNKHHQLFRGRKYANVVSSQLGYGVSRQWESFIENDVHMNFRIFYRMEEAREWLTGPEF